MIPRDWQAEGAGNRLESPPLQEPAKRARRAKLSGVRRSRVSRKPVGMIHMMKALRCGYAAKGFLSLLGDDMGRLHFVLKALTLALLSS